MNPKKGCPTPNLPEKKKVGSTTTANELGWKQSNAPLDWSAVRF
jgi:hypothetical protein